MTTLAEATLLLAEHLAIDFSRGTAASGSATTLVDTARTTRDALFDGGTIWITSGTHIGKSRDITSWDLPTFTFTFPTLTTAVAAGVTYAVAGSDYPREKLIQALNLGILKLNGVIKLDETLTVVPYQEEYTLPTGVTDIKRIEIAQFATAPYYFSPNLYWEVVEGKIRFDPGAAPDQGYTMRIFHNVLPADLVNDADVIDAQIPRKYWFAAGAYYALKARIAHTKTTDQVLLQLLAEAERDYLSALRDIKKLPRDPHPVYWGEL